MKTIEVKLYKFNELDADVQEKVIERRCEELMNEMFFWDEEYAGSLNRFCELFALTYTPSRYDCSVDIKTWELHEHAGSVSGMRLRTWIINNCYDLLYQKKTYYKFTSYSVKHKSKVLHQQADCPLTGFCGDIALVSPFQEFVNREGIYAKSKIFNRTDLQDLILEANSRWDKAINEEYRYQSSREHALELIEANDYDFTENGEIYW